MPSDVGWVHKIILMVGFQFGLDPRILGFKHPLVDLTFQIGSKLEDWFLKLGGVLS